MSERPETACVSVWDIPKLLTPETIEQAKQQVANFPPFTPEQRELLRSTMHIVFPEEES